MNLFIKLIIHAIFLIFFCFYKRSKKNRNYCKVKIGVFILVVAKESNNQCFRESKKDVYKE